MSKDVPGCQADALRRIRQVPVNGVPTGITMLDEIVDQVRERNLLSEIQIRVALLKKVKVDICIPKAAEEVYLKETLEGYHNNIS